MKKITKEKSKIAVEKKKRKNLKKVLTAMVKCDIISIVAHENKGFRKKNVRIS